MKFNLTASVITAILLGLSPLVIAKDYQVTGPVVDIRDDIIVIKKGDENWELSRDNFGADLKIGDRVTLKYRMVVTGIVILRKPTETKPAAVNSQNPVSTTKSSTDRENSVNVKDNPLFDVKTIADQSPEIIQKLLGNPSELRADTHQTRNGRTHSIQTGKYRANTIEITFIENGARFITVFLSECAEYKTKDGRTVLPSNFPSGTLTCVTERQTGYGWYPYPNAASALVSDLGLDRNVKAELSNRAVTRWRNVSGIYEISVFPLMKHVHYLYVMTDRRYQ